MDTSGRTGERTHAGAQIFFLTVTVSSIVQAAEKTDLPDITTATAEQLKAFPGIGETCAEKIIIKGRPCQRKDELVQNKILSRAAYEGITYKFVARQG